MRYHIALVGVIAMVLFALFAKEASAQGFVYGGPLVLENETYISAGISGEKRVYEGLKVVFGVTGFGQTEGSGSLGGAVFSANGAYHFRLRNEKWEPFGTAGVSGLMIGDSSSYGGTGGPNVGGGLTWWFKQSRGLRGEYRLHLYEDVYPQATHEIRFGFVWKRKVA